MKRNKFGVWQEASEYGTEGGGTVEGTGGETAGGEAAEADTSSSDDFDWGGFALEGEDDEGGEAAAEPSSETAESEEPAAGGESAEAPSEEPVAEGQEEPAQGEEEAKAAEESEPAKEEEQASEPEGPTAEEIRQQLTENYGLDDEDVQAIQTNPEENLPKVLPKLAARVHENIMNQVSQGLVNHLPQFIEQVQTQKQEKQKAVESFYERWPKLKGQDEGQIANLMKAYRQAYPNAKREDLIEDVGSMAMVRMKIPFEDQGGGQQQAPARQSASKGQQAPPAPAPGGARPQGNSSSEESKNVFESLTEEILKEDM